MSQNESVYVAGKTAEKSLLAIIRFSTDSAEIDGVGRRVLLTLTNNFRIILEDFRVNFTCVGFADRRADFTYNLRLGLRRSTAVKTHIDRVFGFLPNYSGLAAYSLGELAANQTTRQAAELALDRKVKIYSTWDQVGRRVVPSPQAAHPSVRRIVRRSFSQSTYENTMRPDFTDPKPGIKAGIAVLKGEAARFENVWGPENKTSRVTKLVDASYRVNKVVQKLSYDYDPGASVTVQTWRAEITYEWGDAHDYARVEIRKSIAGQDDYDAKYVPRNETDASPLLTPPDPK